MASPLAKMEEIALSKWKEKVSATKSKAGGTCKTTISPSQKSVIELIRERPGSAWPSPTFNLILHELLGKGLVRYEVNAFGQKEWYENA